MIALAIVGVALAISYYINSIGIDTLNAKLALDYYRTNSLPTVSLISILDLDVRTNTNNVIRVNFSAKGTNVNPNKDIIYDVILYNLNIPLLFKIRI